jgi:lysophospholipase L1-like esterase
MKQKILTLSLIINLIFILIFSYLVYKQHNKISYLVSKTKSILSAESSSTSDKAIAQKSFSARHFDRKSIYESLPDEENEIIFLGDSIVDDGEWTELFKNLKIKNRGVPGDRSDGVLNRLEEVVSSLPDKIFLMIGYNDLSKGVEIADTVANYKEILQTIRDRSPRTKIYIHSVLPVKYDAYRGKVKNHQVIRLNNQLKQLSKQFNLTYIDLFSNFCGSDQQLHAHFAGKDGLHLNGRAYQKWKSILENHIYN